MKKYLLIIISLILCISFIGCSSNNQTNNVSASVMSNSLNIITEPTKEELANTKEYIITQDTLTYLGNTQDDFIADMQNSFNKGLPVATYWKANEDGTVSVFCTPEQAEWERNNAKDFMSKMQDKAVQSGASVEVNEDCTNVVFNLNGNTQILDLTAITKVVLSNINIYQIFNNIPSEQISYNYKMIYLPTGKTITEGRYPDKKLSATAEETEAAKIPD